MDIADADSASMAAVLHAAVSTRLNHLQSSTKDGDFEPQASAHRFVAFHGHKLPR